MFKKKKKSPTHTSKDLVECVDFHPRQAVCRHLSPRLVGRRLAVMSEKLTAWGQDMDPCRILRNQSFTPWGEPPAVRKEQVHPLATGWR